MRGQLFLYFNLLILGSLLTTFIWYTFNNNWHQPRKQHPEVKSSDSCTECSNQQLHQKTKKKNGTWSSDSCKDCRKKINKVLEPYSQVWKKNEENHDGFRSWLRLTCNGVENAIITQKNTPLGSKLIYDGEKKTTLKVTEEHFSIFFQGHPFSNKTQQTCAVVGNGGILANSSCGKMIDSAEFVIRCNLPPLSNGYEKHVGMKTDLVTANPSIFTKKYGSLFGRRRMFVESLCQYGNSMLLLPAFSFPLNTALCLRVLYTIEDFGSPIQPAFLNPKYLESLAVFWRSQGLKETRLSTGIMMTSLALDLCDDVHLYGFWPFSVHPHSFQDLTNHYYDDAKVNKVFHSMSDEFKLLLQLHSQGVLKLHLGECGANE